MCKGGLQGVRKTLQQIWALRETNAASVISLVTGTDIGIKVSVDDVAAGLRVTNDKMSSSQYETFTEVRP